MMKLTGNAAEMFTPTSADASCAFITRVLDQDDQKTVLDFRAKIFESLPDDYRSNPVGGKEFLASEKIWSDQHLGQAALTLGVFQEQKMIAYASLVLPNVKEACFICKNLNLSSDDILKSAIMSACMVLPEFRGQGLQRRLLSWREDMARQLGRCFVYAMTAQVNQYSIRNMERAGLELTWRGELRPGHSWLIFSKKI